MDIRLGIDLGTTFSCVAYIDENGIPKVIPTTEGAETTPSVIWFDGKIAFVGKKANDRKITPGSPIYEFVKRDIGKPRQINTPYEVNGYYYGAAGMSAIILRKLKKEAFAFFKKKGMIPNDAEEKSTIIPAVITVPAYFGPDERRQTRIAGYAAGFDVTALINEPTAAALAYGKTLTENKKIMVFDLGGGTFDISIVDLHNGEEKITSNVKGQGETEGQVNKSKGCNELGGKDWDDLIVEYLYSEYRRRTGKDIPDDMGWEVQGKALQAKFELTENESTIVTISNEGADVEIPLYRENPAKNNMDFEYDMDAGGPFYFEERSSNLLSLCRTICLNVLEEAGLSWGDIDDIVLAGGACRMPMIPAMLEKLTGRKIKRAIAGFSYDTAVAIGAAIYGSGGTKLRDITSTTIGIEVNDKGDRKFEPFILKNEPIPIQVNKTLDALDNAVLKVYQGETFKTDQEDPNEKQDPNAISNYIFMGKLNLENPAGKVKVTMSVNEDGILLSQVEFPPNIRKELHIRNNEMDIDMNDLKSRIAMIDIRV